MRRGGCLASKGAGYWEGEAWRGLREKNSITVAISFLKEEGAGKPLGGGLLRGRFRVMRLGGGLGWQPPCRDRKTKRTCRRGRSPCIRIREKWGEKGPTVLEKSKSLKEKKNRVLKKEEHIRDTGQ